MSATDNGDVTMECTFRPFDGGTVVLRQVALGMTPLVLIEPEVEGDDVIFKIDATGIDRAELAQILGVLAEGLGEADDPEPADADAGD